MKVLRQEAATIERRLIISEGTMVKLLFLHLNNKRFLGVKKLLITVTLNRSTQEHNIYFLLSKRRHEHLLTLYLKGDKTGDDEQWKTTTVPRHGHMEITKLKWCFSVRTAIQQGQVKQRVTHPHQHPSYILAS